MRRFKDHILKDKKFLREVAIILIVGIIVNALCFLLPLVVHAETATTQLPYICNTNPYRNESEIASVLDAITQAYPDDNLQNIIVFLSSEYVWWDYNTYIPSKTYIVYNLSGFTYSSSWGTVGSNLTPNASNFDLYGNDYIDVTFDNFVSYTCTQRGNIGTNYNGMYVYKTTASSSTRRFFSSYQPIHISNAKVDFEYLQNYPVYTNISWFTNDNQANAITYLTDGVSDAVIGEFSDLPSLDELLDNISNSFTGGSSGTTNTPDQNKTDIQNFADFFNNLQSSINSNLNNLGQNIKSWFDNLQKKLTDVANSISTNIWNGFATLMQNIKDFLSPKLDYIIEKFNYITEEPDSNEIIAFIETTSIYSDISSINTSVTTFGSSFTGVSEPDDYTLTFHIEDIDILNQSQPFVLHLNILNPVKSTIRAMLWVIVSYGLFISVVDSLPNYINGGGGEDD